MSMELEIALRKIKNEKERKAEEAVAKVREIREKLNQDIEAAYKAEEESFKILREELGEDIYKMARGMEVRSRKE